MKRRIAVAAIAAIMLAAPAALALNAALPAYQTVTGISGEIKSVGSDTLNSEMELWAKGFKERYAIALRCPINRKLSLTQQVGSVELFRSPPPGVVGYEVLASLPLGAGADTASMA